MINKIQSSDYLQVNNSISFKGNTKITKQVLKKSQVSGTLVTAAVGLAALTKFGKKKIYADLDINEVKADLEAGYSINKLAKKYEMSNSSMRNFLKENNLAKHISEAQNGGFALGRAEDVQPLQANKYYDTLELIDINNISYGESYYFSKQGEKAVDELIKRNPNVKEIKWDAVTEKGMKFKEDYLKKHPELKKKIKGISTKKELDTHINNDYNTSKGVLDETSNKVQELEGSGTKVSRDSSSNDIRSNGQEILQPTQSNNMENVVAGNSSRANARGKNTSNNYEQLEIDFSQAKTPEEIVDTVTSGKAKINEPQDISAMVNKSIELDPEISGTTWEAIAKDSDKLADLMVEADSLGYTKDLQAALSMNDVKAMDGITRKVLAAQKLSSHLGEKLATLGDNPPYEAMSSVIDLIDQIKYWLIGFDE